MLLGRKALRAAGQRAVGGRIKADAALGNVGSE